MSIRDFDNGGQHESPGSRSQKNKTIIFLLILFTKASTSNVSSPTYNGKRYAWRFSSWKKS